MFIHNETYSNSTKKPSAISPDHGFQSLDIPIGTFVRRSTNTLSTSFNNKNLIPSNTDAVRICHSSSLMKSEQIINYNNKSDATIDFGSSSKASDALLQHLTLQQIKQRKEEIYQFVLYI